MRRPCSGLTGDRHAIVPGGVPGGLAAVIVGAAIGWIASAVGWSDYMKGAEVAKAFDTFGVHLPWFSADVFSGLAI